MPLVRNDARNVLLKFVVVGWMDEALTPFDRKYDLDVKLCVGVSHVYISLLTELWLKNNLPLPGAYAPGYGYFAPTEREVEDYANSAMLSISLTICES